MGKEAMKQLCRRLLRLFVLIYAMSASVSGLIWWSVGFYSMAFLHRGVLYIEPNIAVATMEFFVAVGAIPCILWVFSRADKE